jgi:4-amino-4-deoxy-L-arabinose transferase-like glycosyltransferase
VFFPGAPNWSLLPLVLLAGLAAPVFWLINRPSVYEVAIAGGQFFLFLGLYAAIQYATRTKPSPGWLLAAGLAWGAAVNCRLNLGLAVGFFAIMVTWSVIQARKSAWASLSALAWLGIPLLLWAGGMAWYNYARFGSLLETGHRYQLTGMTLTSDYRATFSTAYILPSLYNYLLRMFHFDFHDFPFVFAPFIREDMWPWWIKLPENYYYPEPVAGLLTAVPVLWVAFLPLFGWVRAGWLWLNERPPAARPHTASTWLWVWLAGGFACLFAPLLLFTTNSMRYLADVVPLLVLLAALGWWKGLLYVQRQPVWRGFLSLAVLILIVVSIGMSLLVAFGVGDKRFEANNPALYFQLAHFFLGTAP